MSSLNAPRNRLPTLFEVLSRRTLPPVDLYSFYIFMRDQHRSVDYLDFWLDAAQHTSLCRHYVRELRRSVLQDTPDKQSKRSSQILTIDQLPPEEYGDKDHDQRLSAFLRSDVSSHHSPHTPGRGSMAIGDRPGMPQQSSSESRPSPGRNGKTNGSSPGHTVARADIRASAEKILYTYLLPSSEREIVLPQQFLNEISNAIEVDGRDDPEVFDRAKDYVFQAMERDAFPGFLRAKALGNLVPLTILLRLGVGLLGMFGAFWAAFILIFLDIKPKVTRLWLILPFSIGVYCLIAQQYSLDPIIALFGFSEGTPFHFIRIKEPYVRSLLMKRAVWVLGMSVVIIAALVVLFALVPGHRL